MFQLREVTPNTPEIEKIQQIYRTVFPIEEQLPFELLLQKVTTGKGTFLGLFHAEQLVGFTYYTTNEQLVYLFYVAIDEAKHSKGYGGQLLKMLTERFSDQLVMLLVEPIDQAAANNDQRIRRKAFYERNGFESSQRIIHAMDLDFELMKSLGKAFTLADYEQVTEQFYAD